MSVKTARRPFVFLRSTSEALHIGARQSIFKVFFLLFYLHHWEYPCFVLPSVLFIIYKFKMATEKTGNEWNAKTNIQISPRIL